MIKQYVHNQTGYSLLLTIFAVVLISIIGISILSLTLTTAQVTVTERDHQSSYYIAEAGLVEKRAELNAIASSAYREVRDEYNALDPAEMKDFDFEGVFYSRAEQLVNERLQLTTTSTYEEQQSVIPVSTAAVTKISTSPLTYEITSTGTIPSEKTHSQTKELTQQVQVQMNVDEETEVITIPGSDTVKYRACYSVYATGDFIHDGGSLRGPIYSNGITYLSGGNASITGNVYSKGNVTLKGGGSSINGNVYTEKRALIQGGGAKINGKVYENTNLTSAQNECVHQTPELPPVHAAFPETNVATLPNKRITSGSNGYDVIKGGHLNINNYVVAQSNYVLELDRDVYFKRINIASDYQLKIDLKGQNRRIFVDHLDFQQGSIEFINPGKLELIVQDQFTLTGGSRINQNSSKDNLTIRYAGKNDLQFAGATALNGTIHIKKADMTLSGSNNVNGDILVYGSSDIHITGGSSAADKLIIAPSSNLTLSEGGGANGNIIVKNFSITGGGTINPPDRDYGEWEGPGTADEEIEIIRYPEDGSFLRSDELSEK